MVCTASVYHGYGCLHRRLQMTQTPAGVGVNDQAPAQSSADDADAYAGVGVITEGVCAGACID